MKVPIGVSGSFSSFDSIESAATMVGDAGVTTLSMVDGSGGSGMTSNGTMGRPIRSEQKNKIKK